MRQRAKGNEIGGAVRLIDTEELRIYTGLGRNNAIQLGDEIGARVQIKKRVLWDKAKLDQYFDQLTGVQ